MAESSPDAPTLVSNMDVTKLESWEAEASFLKRFFLHWFTPMIKASRAGQLQIDDLGGILESDRVELVHDRLQSEWEAEVGRTEEGRTPSLIRVFWRTALPRRVLFGWSIAIVFACLDFVVPLLSRAILRHFQDEARLSDAQLWGIAVAMLVAPMCKGLLHAQYEGIMSRVGQQLRTSTSAAIYRKALRLSTAARQQSSTGQITQLMFTDTKYLEVMFMQVLVLITSPVQVAVGFWLLYREIGTALFWGMLSIVAVLPLNFCTFAGISKYFKLVQSASDHRVKLENELFLAIRIIKPYAWETAFQNNIGQAREDELRLLRRLAYIFSIGLNSVFLALPNILPLVSFIAMVYSGQALTPARIFTALQLFGVVRGPITSLPQALNAVNLASVAANRIKVFLMRAEIVKDPKDVSEDKHPDRSAGIPALSIVDGDFLWGGQSPASETKLPVKGTDGEDAEAGTKPPPSQSPPSPPLTLRDINFSVKPGELVAVVGQVGSGKSTLLSALLNEVDKSRGVVSVRGRVALVPQRAFTVYDTVRGNILFHSKMDRDRYEHVLDVCALRPDLAQLKGGDMCRVGQRGINLSGGQQQRLSIARAVYSSADILLFDDPLSAVDAHVSEHLMHQCILKYCRGRTRVLVTNQVQYLPLVDRVLLLDNGSIRFDGTYAELERSGIDLTDLSKSETANDDAGDESKHDAEESTATRSRAASLASQEGQSSRERSASAGDPARPRQTSTQYADTDASQRVDADTLVEDEHRAKGRVSFAVLAWFMKAGGCLTPLFIVTVSSQLYVSLLADFVLSAWTNETAESPTDTLSRDRNLQYLTLYGGATAAFILVVVIGSLFLAEFRCKVGRSLHEGMLASVLRAPISFHDTTPVGRIMNRFSKDQGIVDNSLPMMFGWWILMMNGIVASFLAITIVTGGWFTIALIPISLVYLSILRATRGFFVEVQRIEALTRSPVFEGFSELLNGLTAIRAYKLQDAFIATNTLALNNNLVPSLYQNLFAAWLIMRLNAIGAFITFLTVSIAILGSGIMSASLLGMGLTYAMGTTFLLQQAVFISSLFESQLNAAERIKEYTEEITPEADEQTDADKALPDDWPSQGRVEFKGFSLRYRKGPLVLQDLTFEAQPASKVGVCGRTGSGKSSMINGIFRIVEPAAGSIFIDGIDISTLGLTTLRSRLGLIPQEPTVFTGTVRYNLDPFNAHTDADCWASLARVRMTDVIQALPNGLESEIAEGGESLSVGQRQLLCIARVLLRNPKILILDEATASVDQGTDDFIQREIRSTFASATTLTVAHRLNTIMDSTQIMVLEAGRLVEFDTPHALLQRGSGPFHAMVAATGDDNARVLHDIAQRAVSLRDDLVGRVDGEGDAQAPEAEPASAAGEQQNEEDASGDTRHVADAAVANSAREMPPSPSHPDNRA